MAEVSVAVRYVGALVLGFMLTSVHAQQININTTVVTKMGSFHTTYWTEQSGETRRIRETLSQLHWLRVYERDDAEFVWVFSQKKGKYMLPGQRVNFIKGHAAMTDKGPFAANFRQFSLDNPRNPIQYSCVYPESYHLYDEEECGRLFSQLPHDSPAWQQPWISKPSGLSEGRGIRIYSDLHGLV